MKPWEVVAAFHEERTSESERLSREEARALAGRFLYSPRLGVVRVSWPDGGRDPGPLEELTALGQPGCSGRSRSR
jgi:hypothetical protein